MPWWNTGGATQVRSPLIIFPKELLTVLQVMYFSTAQSKKGTFTTFEMTPKEKEILK